jgi:hypothetical protein
MRNDIAGGSPLRNKGFSLAGVAVAVALLSIVTAFSLPRLSRLASHARSSAAAAENAAQNFPPTAYAPHQLPGVEPPAAVKIKLMDVILGYPAGASSVLTNWGGFSPAREPNLPAIAKSDAPSGDKCALPDSATISAKNAAAGAKHKTNGC